MEGKGQVIIKQPEEKLQALIAAPSKKIIKAGSAQVNRASNTKKFSSKKNFIFCITFSLYWLKKMKKKKN